MDSPVGQAWQGLREELARETEAKDPSGDLDDSMGWVAGGRYFNERDTWVLTACCRHPWCFESVTKVHPRFSSLVGRDHKCTFNKHDVWMLGSGMKNDDGPGRGAEPSGALSQGQTLKGPGDTET